MNTADEDAQMERDEWASREVMPITIGVADPMVRR